ncbi:MAG: S41 family peptidase [Bacilli bacterium]|jgi:carboxyl-terminal processing protease|nr:S41 family peptidase [Bacilli bacterium]
MNNTENKNSSKVFNLGWILAIVVATSIISALTTGVIIYNNNKIGNKLSYSDLTKDEKLNQFLEVYANITSDYYQDVNKEELLEKAISAMMNYLGDDYTGYLNNDNTNDLMTQLAGKYNGIGVAISNEDKSISKVYDDTPASKAGIQAGDIIVGVNDVDVSSISAAEVVNMIKSNKDYFTLKLKRGEEILSVSVKNENIISPNIEYNVIENTKIGYMSIDAFSSTLDIQMEKALKKLESDGITSLIIDLRNNTGGYLDMASKVTSMFIKKGEKIYSLNEKNQVNHYFDETDEHREYPIVILTNNNTASASEIMAAALKESYGADLVGETTFGKGKVQQTMKLDDGSMVKYTSAYWLTPNGTCIDETGITPNYLVSNEEILDEEGRVTEIIDRQLEKAINLLTEEKSLETENN